MQKDTKMVYSLQAHASGEKLDNQKVRLVLQKQRGFIDKAELL